MNPILIIATDGTITEIRRQPVYDNPPVPLLLAFENCEGFHVGKPVEWLGKAFRVLVNGRGFIVMPSEMKMAVW